VPTWTTGEKQSEHICGKDIAFIWNSKIKTLFLHCNESKTQNYVSNTIAVALAVMMRGIIIHQITYPS
jgi:hypothetical protein